MVSAWNAGELDQMVLPPCHYGFQMYTRKLTLAERIKTAKASYPKFNSSDFGHADGISEEEFQHHQLDEKYPGRTVHHEDNAIVVTIPVKFYRRNGRQVVKAKAEVEEQSNVDQPDVNMTLVAAIAKAYAWQEELESGQFNSTEELADAKQVGRTYASRLLRLTSLCPEIVDSILAGDESHGLSLRQLHKGIPDCWKEQKVMFGF